MTARHDLLRVGYISGLYGVKGWVRVFSYTDPPDNILSYDPWTLETQTGPRVVALLDARTHGAGLIARLEGIDDRDAAAPLVGVPIAVRRGQLPPPAAGEYYWADLVGLEVFTGDGRNLGKVARLFQTGANDVMVVLGERERLIPWIAGDVIAGVDLAGGRITVLWDPDF